MFDIPILFLKANAKMKRRLVGYRKQLASAPQSPDKNKTLNAFKRTEANIKAFETEVRQFIKQAQRYLESEKGVSHGR